MAVYKIPQDVEADDKFVGPLSFKQFIFAGIAAVAGYLLFITMSKGFWPALFVLVPIIIIAGFLGFPWGRDQPTEIWLAARIRFFIKPRVRIWNQTGINELVTVTAPKKIEKVYTNGLTQNEVESRLTGLATLIDSRGWAIKNATQDNTYVNQITAQSSDDRLLDVASVMPQEVTDTIHATDILDESSNSTAQHFDEMIKQSEQKHREELLQQMQKAIHKNDQPQPTTPTTQGQPADFWFLGQQATQGQAPTVAQQAPVASQPTQTQGQPADFWFLNGSAGPAADQTAPATQNTPQTPLEPAYTTFNQAATVAPHMASSQPVIPVLQDNTAANITQEDEEALLKKVHNDHLNPGQKYGNLRTIMPLGQEATTHGDVQQPQQQTQQQPENTMTTPVDPAIIKLASNDDLNIDTIARQAHLQTDNNDGEVVVSLH